MSKRFRRKNSDTLATSMEIKTFPEPMSGCFLWHGTMSSSGYPIIKWQGKPLLAHRVAYELATGIAPGEKLVCHKCDNTYCVNPDHLFLGTALDNNRDRSSKGRNAKNYHSEIHHMAVLTDDEVAAIRAEYVKGDPMFGTNALARKYGSSQGTIWQIVNNKVRNKSVPMNGKSVSDIDAKALNK